MESSIKKTLYIFSILAIILVILIVFADRTPTSDKKRNDNEIKKTQRIISLSPSITETLFALNLGEQVVGVTRFCNYPNEAKKIMNIGGYLDLNYEVIVTLKPDVVILLPEHAKAKKYLTEFGIRTIEVDNKTIADILGSIRTIGDSCDAKLKANNLLEGIKNTIVTIKNKTDNLLKPNTLVVISRTFGIGILKDVYIAGVPTYFNEIIEMAGGVNAFKNSSIAYPNISTEGLIHLNPEVIIDFVNNLSENNLTKEIVLQDWESVEFIKAVKNSRITVLDSDYISIPGPRFILLLKDIAEAIHPEINWEE